MKYKAIMNLHIFDEGGDGGNGGSGNQNGNGGTGSSGQAGSTGYTFEQAEEIANSRAERAHVRPLQISTENRGSVKNRSRQRLLILRQSREQISRMWIQSHRRETRHRETPAAEEREDSYSKRREGR